MPSVVQLALSQLLTIETYSEVVTDLLEIAQALGLNTTAWQKLGITRTTITTIAQKIADLTGNAVDITSGGFLTLANDGPLDAAGNVTPGMVDLCAYNQFNVQRTFAQPATCTESVINATSNSFSAGPGGMRFANPVTGATYTSTNTATFTVPAGQTLPIQIAADVPGTVGSSGVGAISQLAVPITGISCTNVTAAVGIGATPKATLVSSCQAKLSSISPDGAPGAYVFFAQNPQLPNGTPQALNYGAITQAIATYGGFGVVEVILANAAGPVEGCFQVAISVVGAGSGPFASNAQLLLGSPHHLITGDTVTVNGVATTGGLIVNGTWTVTVISSTLVVLNGSVFVGTGGGGQLTGGDLGTCALSVLANATPIGSTPSFSSAAAVSLNPIGTIYVHNATQTPTQILSAISTALTNWMSTVPIGAYGTVSNPVDSGGVNVIPITMLTSVIASALPGVIVSVNLTSPSADFSIGNNGVPVAGWTSLATLALNVVAI